MQAQDEKQTTAMTTTKNISEVIKNNSVFQSRSYRYLSKQSK